MNFVIQVIIYLLAIFCWSVLINMEMKSFKEMILGKPRIKRKYMRELYKCGTFLFKIMSLWL